MDTTKFRKKSSVVVMLIIALLAAIAIFSVMFLAQASSTQAVEISLDDNHVPARNLPAREAFAGYEFDYSTINIVLTPMASRQFLDYSVYDFSEINVMQINDLTAHTVNYVQQVFEFQNSSNVFRLTNDSDYEALVDRIGGNSSPWQIRLTNPNPFEVSVTFNTRLAFRGDARNHTNLLHLETITISGEGYALVDIRSNAAADFFTAGIDFERNGEFFRLISYADGLRQSPSRINFPNWNVISTSGTCVVEGTLITLADGSQVAVEYLTGNEELLVWNFYTGEFDTAPIFFVATGVNMPREILHLQFENGSYIKMVYQHAFFNLTINRFIDINSGNASDFLGHYFKQHYECEQGNLSWEAVKLVGVDTYVDSVRVFAPITERHFVKYANGFLSGPSDHEAFLNVFEVDVCSLSFCVESRESLIAEFGLMTFEEFSAVVEGVSEFFFDAYRGEYIGLLIGSGAMNRESIFWLLEKYAGLLGGVM